MESTQLKIYDRGTWANSNYRTIQLAAKDIGSSSHYIIIKSKTIWTSKNTYVGIDSTSSSSSSSTAGTTKYITVDGITYKLTTNNPDSITPNFVKDGVIYQNGIAIGRTLSAATQLSSAEIDSLSIGSDGKIKKGGNIIGYRTPTSGAVAGTPGSAQSTSQLIPTTDRSGRITGYNKVTTNTDGSTISTPNFVNNNDIYIKGQKISVQNTAGLTDDDLKNVKSYKDGVFTLSSSSTTPLGQADATSFKLSGESIVYQKGTGVIAKVTSIKDPAGKILGRVESPGPASTSTDSKFKISDSAITI
ncbi:MAG: hypothetical protein KKC75_07315, partial [Nanoarchaeota archaeon]|nr:hypothetical protein [Nanoarchaeota archaeon]